MTLRTTLALLCIGALFAATGCNDSHDERPDAGEIIFDATFPDTGTDSGPPPNNVGANCESDADCRGPADTCFTDFMGFLEFPAGYCSAACTTSDECPEGSVCLAFQGPGFCALECNPGETDQCPAGNGCFPGGQGIPPVCFPGCETDAECGNGNRCAVGSGSFGSGQCIDPDAPLGGACTDSEDCPTSAACATVNEPGGSCILPGCSSNEECPDDARCLQSQFGGNCVDGCVTSNDCRPEYECVDSSNGRICRPRFVPANLGQTCSNRTGGCPGGQCLSESQTGFPGAYCVDPGCDPNAAVGAQGCAGDGVCIPSGDGRGLCLDGCDPNAATPCRGSYRCRPVDFENPARGNACLPGCTNDSECTAMPRGQPRYTCNPGTGYCGPAPLSAGEIGEPCMDEETCDGGRCVTEADDGWPAGTCAQPGCRLSGTGPALTCPSGTTCIDDEAGDPAIGMCVRACTVTEPGAPSTCRPGYACVATDGTTAGSCRPRCTAASCVGTCDVSTGLCSGD